MEQVRFAKTKVVACVMAPIDSRLTLLILRQDALDVIDIMRTSLYDAFCDEFGQVDLLASREDRQHGARPL